MKKQIGNLLIFSSIFIFCISFQNCSKQTSLLALEPSSNSPICAPDGEGKINVVTQCGALGDGMTDNTVQIQKALDSAGAAGGAIVYFPVGKFVVRGTLVVPDYVVMKGIFSAPNSAVNWHRPGTYLMAYSGRGNESGAAFITLSVGSTIDGMIIYYPEQITSPPTPYPPTIKKSDGGDGIIVQNTMLLNPWIGIDLTAPHGARHFIRGVYGEPFKIGIDIDNNFDVGRIENVHFWSFLSGASAQLQAFNQWHLNNTIGIRIKRSDEEMLTNIFMWTMKTGIEISAGPLGTAYGDFSNINLDAVKTGVDASACNSSGLTIRISNLEVNADKSIFNHGGCLQVNNAFLVGSPYVVHQTAGSLQITNSQFFPQNSANGVNTNPATTNAFTVFLDGGRAVVNGNIFQDVQGIGIKATSRMDRVIVTL